MIFYITYSLEVIVDCDNETCIGEIDQLEAEISCCIQQSMSIKQQYQRALIENLKKDIIIYDLTKKQNETKFEEFIGAFSTETISSLRSFDSKVDCDSSFVLAAVRGLYGDNLQRLKNKSYSGISRDRTKEPLTPEKLTCLRSLYEKRLHYIDNIDVHESALRKNKFAKHVKTALETINNKTKN